MGQGTSRTLAILLISLSFMASVSGAQVIGSNSTKAFANTIINNTITIIEAVNESSYLIFSPNLTRAYADLNRSMLVYNVSPEASIVLANRAANDALTQYSLMSAYKEGSLVVMLAMTAVLALILSKVMKPVVKRHAGSRKASKKG
jgi:hypothetical protein